MTDIEWLKNELEKQWYDVEMTFYFKVKKK
jgi:hypothetical protein